MRVLPDRPKSPEVEVPTRGLLREEAEIPGSLSVGYVYGFNVAAWAH